MSPTKVIVAFAASSAFNLLLIFLGRGSIVQFVVVGLALSTAFVLLCLGCFLSIISAKSQAWRRIGSWLIVFGGVAASGLVSVPIGWQVNQYDIGQAKAFCDRLRPELETRKQATGRYPEHLPQNTKGQLPRLLKGSEFYHSYGDSYGFSFSDPAGMMNGIALDSCSGDWYAWD